MPAMSGPLTSLQYVICGEYVGEPCGRIVFSTREEKKFYRKWNVERILHCLDATGTPIPTLTQQEADKNGCAGDKQLHVMWFVCARELLLDGKRSLPHGLSAACNVPRKHSQVLALFLGFGGWIQSRHSLLLWVHAASICPFLLNHALTGPSSWVILVSVLLWSWTQHPLQMLQMTSDWVQVYL